MAVYTEVSDEDLARFIDSYGLGELLSCKGIAEGVENTNFLVQTAQGRFILTLYEKRVQRDDLPFFLGLMEHLAKSGINCPTPVRDRAGSMLRELAGRPAALTDTTMYCLLLTMKVIGTPVVFAGRRVSETIAPVALS